MRRRLGGLRGVAVLAALSAAVVVAFASSASAGGTSTYLVLYKGSSVPANAAQTIQQAGGTLSYSYDAIGVAIAS